MTPPAAPRATVPAAVQPPAAASVVPAVAEPSAGTDVSMLLSFTAGFVDTFGFIALFGLFTAHVTGNFVLIGAAISSGSATAIAGKLAALPVFVLGVLATRAYQLTRTRRGLPSGVHLVAAQLLLLSVFAVGGAWSAPHASGNELSVVVVGLLGVLAMSIQNIASRSTFSKMSPSTVMTGNVTQWTMDAVDRLFGGAQAEAAAARMKAMGPAIGAFFVGSLGGGVGYAVVGYWALAAPLVALGAVLGRLLAAPAG